MTENYYLIMVGKDSFICQIEDDEKNLDLDQEKQIIKSIKTPFIVITNAVNVVPNGQKMLMFPCHQTTFGHKYLTLNVSQIEEIQFAKDKIVTQAKAVLANLVLSK